MKNKNSIPVSEVPTHFMNMNYYLKRYLGKISDPPLNPATGKPVTSKDLEPLFARELISQEMSLEELIAIPEEVRNIYLKYRSTPLVRAINLEKALDTPARIYYKNESATLSGSHKINTALVQAYYCRKEGVKSLTTETGAGQWGSALSIASSIFGLKCLVFMVRVSYEQKPYRKFVMHTLGADVVSSPSERTEYGRKVLIQDPNSTGSLGIAISEALETAVNEADTKYALGSVLNHVLLHQSIVGQEAKSQMEKYGDYPDIIIGCVGGGSNFMGFATPFLADRISGKAQKLQAIAVEAAACPKMTRGEYKYDFGDTAQMTPMLKMDTLGSDFIPPAIHAGGLRYHGNAPILSLLHQEGVVKPRAYTQTEAFKAGIEFAKSEGIIPAPESSFAIKAAIDEAVGCKEEGQQKTIVFNLSGHGLLDMAGYNDYLEGRLN